MQTHIFNSQIPVSFREDGYLNATAIATHFGKQPKDYLKNQQTQEYIVALAEFLSVRRKILTKENQIVIIKQGGTEQGTWLHPKLAVHFARWLDASFAVWCDMKIEEIISGSYTNTQHDPRINPAQKQTIREAVKNRVYRTGETYQAVYERLHSFLRVNSYHEIQAADFKRAIMFLESIANAPAKPAQNRSEETVIRNAHTIKGAMDRMIWYYEQTIPAMKLLNRDLYVKTIESYKVLRIYSQYFGRIAEKQIPITI